MTSRRLDHLVLPTPDLVVARERLQKLGFTVAPDGIHPFGTVNACVYFEDGTFLEPLAVRDPDAVAEAVAQGNVFVGQDALYRSRRGKEGLSALVLASDDADADHHCFVAAGVSAGDRLDFSRPVRDAAGKADTASFRLAFARLPAAPDLLVFTCERGNAPKVDRAALTLHDNGATAILGVTVGVADADALRGPLAAVLGTKCGAGSGDFALELANARVTFRSSADAGSHSGENTGQDTIAFAVSDLSRTEDVLRRSGVAFTRTYRALTVAPAAGQGATFVFDAMAGSFGNEPATRSRQASRHR